MGTYMAISTVDLGSGTGFHLNTAPAGFERQLPKGFLQFLEPLHRRFTPRQQELVAKRKQVFEASLDGKGRFQNNTGIRFWLFVTTVPL